MTTAILIAAVLVAALACPVMMWLGRRGIGPGCAMMNCKPEQRDESLDTLKQRQRELDLQIAQLEPDGRPAAKNA